MAPKRTAAAAAKAPREAKAAKVDPSIERCKPVLELLKEFGSNKLPASCVKMLRETAPLALATTKDQRHKFQSDVISGISDLCADLTKEQAASVREADMQVADGATGKERLEQELTQLGAVEEAKRAAKSAASADLEAAQATEMEATAGLESARKEVVETESNVAANTEAKKTFEATFAETWPALRDGTFSSKDWRARNKAIGVIVPMLTGAPESLRSGLAMALKERPETRGQFALKTIDYAESAFQDQIAGMAAEIGRLTTALDAARASVEQAEAKLKADVQAKDQAWETSIAAENAWAEAESEVIDVKKKIRSFDGDQSARIREAEDQKALQERLRELIAGFEALRDFTTPVNSEEAAEAEAAAEMVTA